MEGGDRGGEGAGAPEHLQGAGLGRGVSCGAGAQAAALGGLEG